MARLFEVLTAVLKIQVFCDAAPCRLVNIAVVSEEHSAFIFRVEQFKKNSLLGQLYPGDETSTLLRNVGNYLPVDDVGNYLPVAQKNWI